MENSFPTTYNEVKIGKTLYRVTSVFMGEKDLGETLENLAVRGVISEIRERRKTPPQPLW